MKVAIVGSSGYIAGFIMEKLKNESSIESILKIDQSGDADAVLDLQNAEKFDYSVLEEIDYVIFTAAISGPDKCALDYEFCWKINVTGTEFFISKAIDRGLDVSDAGKL